MPNPVLWDVDRLRAAVNAAEVGLWSWNVDTDEVTLDRRAFDLWGHPPDSHVTFEELSSHIHPKDMDRVRAAFAATRPTLGTFEIDFRIMLGNEIRWISARGQGDDKDIAFRLMFGVFLDVTQRKQAEESNELLAGEMSHRVRNLLQIASALTHIAASSSATVEEMANDLGNRLMALGRAHNLVRPTDGSMTQAVLLGDLMSVLLSPYDLETMGARRIRISLPRLGVGEKAITPLALVAHELATNSLKYGALSVPTGTLDVSAVTSANENELSILWVERGGPPVVAPNAQSGFGSRMVRHAVSRDLCGSISFDWPQEGVVVTLRVDEDCLSH
ncbi:MAG: PAS domain-containing protein [Rhodospirillales bacterium]|nr:PAS domain-containing protein [Rhodospirillales bacterium]